MAIFKASMVRAAVIRSDMAGQPAMIKWEERNARRDLAEARQAANASADLLGTVHELASFLKDYE
jgi:hypothetical protein